MFAAVSQFDASPAVSQTASGSEFRPDLQRAEGAVRVGFRAGTGGSRLSDAYQRGSMKVRFPRQFDTDVPEAVLINTAGGITGGDRFRVDGNLGTGAAATLTTQAAEKVYRSSGGDGRVDVSLHLEPSAQLAWLPQETILFDRGRLVRTLDVEMAADAGLVLCESVILGRAAHGETVRQGLLTDRWRVRRGGRLVYADFLKLAFPMTAPAGAAVLAGSRAFASLLVVDPDAEARIEAARSALDGPATAGASAWNGMLAVRLAAPDGSVLRDMLIRLCGAIGVRLPRAWSI